MILAHHQWEQPIDLDEQNSIVLSIRDSSDYFRYTRELYLQSMGSDGGFSFSDREKYLNLETEIDIIADIPTLTLNNRRMITHLHKKLTHEFGIGDNIVKLNDYNEIMINLLRKLRQDTFINFIYDEDVGFGDYLKLFSVKYAEATKTALQLLFDYVDILKDIGKMKVIILYSPLMILDLNSLDQFREHCLLHSIRTVFIERGVPNEVKQRFKVSHVLS